jgi:hypothetical protein
MWPKCDPFRASEKLFREATVWLSIRIVLHEDAHIQAWAVSTALDNAFSRMFQVKNVSSGMWLSVGLVSIDVSEKRVASNFRIVKTWER